MNPAIWATIPLRVRVFSFVIRCRTYSFTVWTLIVRLLAISLFVSPRINPFRMACCRLVKWHSGTGTGAADVCASIESKSKNRLDDPSHTP
jgi:hypothetical protein